MILAYRAAFSDPLSRTRPLRTVDDVARALHKAGKIDDLCEGEGVFSRLTSLERQYPSASVLVHKQGVLPPEIASLWACPQLMSAAHQFLGGKGDSPCLLDVLPPQGGPYTCMHGHPCRGSMHACMPCMGTG